MPHLPIALRKATSLLLPLTAALLAGSALTSFANPVDFSMYGFARIDAVPRTNAGTPVNYPDSRGTGSKVTTGGGIIPETDTVQYAKVTTAQQFGAAIGNASVRVVEVMNDIDLTTFPGTSSNVTNKASQALKHPALLGKFVKLFAITSNKTVFSKNGAFLSRGCLNITNQHNIIVRNLHLGQIWEWDETDVGNEGFLKWNRNDWDGLTVINNAHHIWIDHCTIDATYDGQADITNGCDMITVSWCKFQGDPICDLVDNPTAFAAAFDASWFGQQYNALAANLAANPQFVGQLIGPATALATKIAFARKWAVANKGNLWGSGDTSTVDPNHLNITSHHNWSQNVRQRSPRVRFGDVHVFSNLLYNADGYGVGLGNRSNVLVERTAFLNVLAAMQTIGMPGAGRAVDSFTYTGSLDSVNGIMTPSVPGVPVVPDAVTTVWHAIANAAAPTWWQLHPGVAMEDDLPYPKYLQPETLADIPDLMAHYAGAGKISLDWRATTHPLYNRVTDVVLDHDSLSYEAGAAIGGTAQLAATVLPANANNPALAWSSDNPAVATVSSSGLVTLGSAAGAAIIKAKAVDANVSDSCIVTVADTTPPVVGPLKASPNTLGVPAGQMVPVTLTVNAHDSFDPSPVSTIDEVTCNQALAAGDVVITPPLGLSLKCTSTSSPGRIYTIKVKTVDASGNAAFSSATVTAAPLPLGPRR